MLFKLLRNKEGVALLYVMAFLSVIMIIVSLTFNMVIDERKMTINYMDQKQAYYIAEAAADQAINTFIAYVNNSHESSDQKYAPLKLNITDDSGPNYSSILSGVLESGVLKQKFENSLGTSDISISYSLDEWDQLTNGYVYDYDSTDDDIKTDLGNTNIEVKNYKTIIINITTSYKDEECQYKLRLRYCKHGAVYEYKGDGDW